MKKLQFFKVIIFVFCAFIFNNGYSQTASDWNMLYNNVKKALAKFPTIAKINNANLPVKSKELLLHTRRTLTVIAETKTQPDKETSKRLFARVSSLPKEMQKNGAFVMNVDNDGTKPTAKTCTDKYNKCMEEHSCEYDSWLCVCCIPCSLEYLGCMGDIFDISSILGIKTNPPGTATKN